QDAIEAPPKFLWEYFTRHLVYDLGAAEQEGLRRFQRSLRDLGLIETCYDLRYLA
ncbi:hypothetical protein HQ590_08395, partial [bacterium]|nr:hypothetical protein [bacterium]